MSMHCGCKLCTVLLLLQSSSAPPTFIIYAFSWPKLFTSFPRFPPCSISSLLLALLLAPPCGHWSLSSFPHSQICSHFATLTIAYPYKSSIPSTNLGTWQTLAQPVPTLIFILFMYFLSLSLGPFPDLWLSRLPFLPFPSPSSDRRITLDRPPFRDLLGSPFWACFSSFAASFLFGMPFFLSFPFFRPPLFLPSIIVRHARLANRTLYTFANRTSAVSSSSCTYPDKA